MSLGYVRSLLVTAPLIFLYTAVMATLSLASSLFDSRGRMQHGCARIWARMILLTSGIRLRVTGLENLKPDVPYILCPNHQSHMDTPVMLAALPFQFRFTPKKELFRIPFLGWHLRRSGHVPIDRENPHAAIKSLREAAESIRRGTRVVVFPEGGTSLDGFIKPFKRGAFMLAAESGAAVVPVTIRGTRSVLTPRTYHVRSGLVDVIVGVPMATEGVSSADMANRVHDEVLTTFKHGKALDRNSYSLSREV